MSRATINDTEIIEQFNQAMAAQGIVLTETIKADGKLHRYHVDGDKRRSRNAWAVLHLEGKKPAGAFGCNRQWGVDVKFTWSGKQAKPLSLEDRRAWAKKMAAQKAEREAVERERRQAAAEHARFMWDQAQECTEHPYLTRKGVKSHGLRVGSWEKLDRENGKLVVVSKQALLIPIRDAKKNIHSLQAIFCGKAMGDRDKDFVKDGAKAGLFYSFGKPQTVDVGGEQRQVIMIGEGYATMASAHECTGHAAIVAFDAGNLSAVGRVLRDRFPDAVLLFLSDNDQWTKTPVDNPGLTKACEAAKAVGGLVAVPPFAADELGKPTDFNDFHQLRGADAVRQVIEAALEDGAWPERILVVPTEDEARGVAYAYECLGRLAKIVADRGGAPHVANDTLVLAANGDLAYIAAIVRIAYPATPLTIFAALGGGGEAHRVATECGGYVTLPPSVAGWAGWGEHLLDMLFDHIDAAADADPTAHGLASHVLERVTRDEDRRRQMKEENQHIQEMDSGKMIPSDLSVDAMIERCVWVADGRHVAYVTEDRSMFLKFDDFRALTASSKTEIEVQQREKLVSKSFPNANLWQTDDRRLDTMTATFRPGSAVITANPNGLRAVNTWRPIKRWQATKDITPFLEQVEYLFPDATECNVFLDWLAHIEQKPGELPHYGWLHIAENTGTGRNWMASVLARVFRGYVAPNVDLPALLESPYNGELGGRVLAIVDEVQEGVSEGNYRHAERLKSMVNAEMRTVNNKYGMKYLEFNALRWLVFSNHKNALPLNDEDRRFRVVMHKAPPRAPEAYVRLYSLLVDPEFINSVGVYLRERNISRFRPGERPPLNADKRAAIVASKPMSTQAAEEIVACWPADVITYKNAAALITGDPERKDFPPALRRAMESAGAEAWHQGDRIKIKLGALTHRLWVLRNHPKWLGESMDAVRKEILRAGVDDPSRPAAVVLADAAEAADGLREPQF